VHPSANSPTVPPDLATKVAFLRSPGNYPEGASRVDVVETHMSWVFLTDTRAYKLKKPVRYDYLDFSTPDARRADCEEEVRLNRRLAAGVYLGVVPLRVTSDGSLSLGEMGGPVDWLVKMKRLPSEWMLDTLLLSKAIGSTDLHALARRLAAFYAGAKPEPVTPERYRQQLLKRIEENLRELARTQFGLPQARLRQIARAQQSFLELHGSALADRVSQGRIVEAHGDLRPEHVCLLPEHALSHVEGPVVIDCLEFNREFRILDALDDLAFLALECERLGAPEIGVVLLDEYRLASGDDWPQPLLDFHQSQWAMLRAKLAVWHLLDDGRHPPEKWVRRANEYLELAERHIGAC
jgi:aminoglycoside phosphotransferase family enzyme